MNDKKNLLIGFQLADYDNDCDCDCGCPDERLFVSQNVVLRGYSVVDDVLRECVVVTCPDCGEIWMDVLPGRRDMS
jgi:hypothetical protein